MITSGLIPVSQKWDPTVTEKNNLSYFPRIDSSRTNFSAWRDISENLHAYGCRFFIQLTAGLGRVGSPECLLKKLKFPVSASWNPNFYLPSIPCAPLRDGQLKGIIKALGTAAIDAKTLLIDGIYFHGHEGYLLEQLSNPAYNKRSFGKYANWQRFGIDAVKEIRRKVGDKFPIMYRIDLSLALNATYGERMKKVGGLKKFRNERTIQMTLDYMKNLVKAGVDMFDVDLGGYDNWWLPHPPNGMPPGCYLGVAKLVRDYFHQNNILSNQNQEIPIVGVGKLGYPDLAERALRENYCDMVMLARPLLADPDWPNKAYAGKIDEICPCIGDQEGCFNEFISGGNPQCSVNPRTVFEDVIPETLPVTSSPKKIAVVGAGPAGVICACTAATRGHKVTLIDQHEKAGGTLIVGSIPKIKYELSNYVDYLNTKVSNIVQKYDLTTQFNTSATLDDLKDGGYDSIVFSTGGRPKTLNVPGIDLPNVIQSVDLFQNPDTIADAKSVLVVGGGSVGLEAAQFISYELKKPVTVIEMIPYFMKTGMHANRSFLIHYLELNGVKSLNWYYIEGYRIQSCDCDAKHVIECSRSLYYMESSDS